MKIVTAAQMRALDQAAIQERGIPSLQLMDRAAAAVTERCLARLAGKEKSRVAVFCGAVNCPVASIFLSVELFGDGGLLYFALICGISYMLSGYNGLYSSQTILYSKLKAQYINVHTNAHHAGNPHAEPPVRGSLKEE